MKNNEFEVYLTLYAKTGPYASEKVLAVACPLNDVEATIAKFRLAVEKYEPYAKAKAELEEVVNTK